MKITILTLFDNVYTNYLNSSIIKNALDNKLVEIEIINFRKYSKDKHLKVDDYQYGGGAGMVLMLQPIVDAIKEVRTNNSLVCLTSPTGKTLNQEMLIDLAKQEHIILIAGHYEGFDSRIENFIDCEISIGDYILTGGELPTLVILDGIVRLLPNVINNTSLVNESFNDNLLDHPIYTKPIDFNGYKVPDILLSGNHKAIDNYRLEERIKITKKKRPDLYNKYISSNRKD